MRRFDPSTLDPAELLGRPELPVDLSLLRREVGGRAILVTGAGGSVGVNLAELLIQLEPTRLVLLDHHDHALFALSRRLEARANGGHAWQLALADVRDREKLARTLDATRPDIVFHLAAYKHVPFGEAFPEETFAVNVVATYELLQLCAERAIERFVYPSSDKAVRPPSVYGATKRISEVLVQHAAVHADRRYSIVRYVNIIGTNGSAIETFAEQLAADAPLTVTDSAMTRYWISMREATWLIASAAARGAPGSVMMLDAREDIPVVAIARRVEKMLAPGEPERPIRFTGARPGERLREELLTENETFQPGPAPGLLVVHNQRTDDHVAAISDHLAGLRKHVDAKDADGLKAAAMAVAWSLQ